MRKNHCRNLTLHVDCNFIFARTMTYSVFRKGYIEYGDLKAVSKQARFCIFILSSLCAEVFISCDCVRARCAIAKWSNVRARLFDCVRAFYVRISYKGVIFEYCLPVQSIKHVYSRSHSHIGASHINKVMLTIGEYGLVAQTH